MEIVHARIVIQRGVVFLVQLKFDRGKCQLVVEFYGGATEQPFEPIVRFKSKLILKFYGSICNLKFEQLNEALLHIEFIVHSSFFVFFFVVEEFAIKFEFVIKFHGAIGHIEFIVRKFFAEFGIERVVPIIVLQFVQLVAEFRIVAIKFILVAKFSIFLVVERIEFQFDSCQRHKLKFKLCQLVVIVQQVEQLIFSNG